MAISKKQKLQALADCLRTEDQYQFEVVWRGFSGWWAVRYYGDRGEYLGQTFAEARLTLARLLG